MMGQCDVAETARQTPAVALLQCLSWPVPVEDSERMWRIFFPKGLLFFSPEVSTDVQMHFRFMQDISRYWVLYLCLDCNT